MHVASLKTQKQKVKNMTLVTEEIKAKGEVFHGPELCKEKVKELLAEIGLPNGLLPLDNIQECGRIKETGFVWFKREAKKEYKFKTIGKLISYGKEVTGFVEKNKIRKLKGVKSKEVGVWVSIQKVTVSDPEKILFTARAGLSLTFPFSAFKIEDADEVEVEVPEEEEVEDVKEGEDSD